MLDRVSLLLVIIGALNWLLVGLFQFDAVAWLCGGQTAVIAMNGTLINKVHFGYQRQISDIFYFATAVPDGG